MSIFDTFLNYRVFIETLPLLLSGLSTTLVLGIVCIALGFVCGLVLALARLYGITWVRYLTIAYIDTFRAIPILVLLFVIYYALPFVGIRLSSFVSATAAISMVAAAYCAEILRAGIEAVPRGQFEAARALGLRPWRIMSKVILPQAIKIVVPPLTSNSINVMKDTALASVVAMPDLLKQANQAQALAANPTPLIVAAVIYLIILLPLVRMVAMFEAH
jgi:polar amino acid transport system permease protein